MFSALKSISPYFSNGQQLSPEESVFPVDWQHSVCHLPQSFPCDKADGSASTRGVGGTGYFLFVLRWGWGPEGLQEHFSLESVSEPGSTVLMQSFSVLGTAVRGPLTGRRLCQPRTMEGEGPGGEGASAVGHWEMR